MHSDQQWTKGKLLGTSSAYWEGCTLHAGVKLEIFTLLAGNPLTAREAAEKIQGSERGTGLLLNALVAMGLLEHRGDTYANTDFADQMLNRNSADYLGYIINHHHHLVEAWSNLSESVLTGMPGKRKSLDGEVERESFLMGMYNLSLGIAPVLANLIDLRGKTSLLDLGGGPGVHAIHFCLANPELRATIFDRPTTRPIAEKIVDRFGLSERINFIGGDFIHDPLPGPHDAAWLSHILHSNPPEECRHLIEQTVQTLRPGGLIMIHEFFLNDTLDGPLFPALFSLNMLLGNHGRSYAEREIRDMLARVGISDIKRLDFTGPNSSGVLIGKK